NQRRISSGLAKGPPVATWIGRSVVILLVLRAAAAPVALRPQSAPAARLSPVLRVCSWPVRSPEVTPDRPDLPGAGAVDGLAPSAPTILPPRAWPRRGPLDEGREAPFARYLRRAADRPLR